MRLLADTHVLLWWLADDDRLTDRHRTAISDGANSVAFSSVSIAEIAIKASLGKLTAPAAVTDALRDDGLVELPFTAAHAELLRTLPWHHRDPFDRMLIAQAMAEGLTLASVDHHVRAYAVAVL